MDLIRKSTR